MPRIAIIGGGASGLAAAVTIKQLYSGIDTEIFERMPRLGKKILATGNGRCNLSHEAVCASAYHGSVRIDALLSEIPDIKPFFESCGMLVAVDRDGRLYPYSNSAATVLDTLLNKAKSLGVIVHENFSVNDIVPEKNGFTVTSEVQSFFFDAVILAAGGCANPSLGSDGSGFSLAEKLGLSVVEPRPALCPLLSDKKLLKTLDGVRVKAGVTLKRDGKPIKCEMGEVQFTSESLSGICIFNLSGFAEKNDIIELDLMPELSFNETLETLHTIFICGSEKKPSEWLCGIFNRKIALALAERTEKNLKIIAKKLKPDELKAIAKEIKSFSFPVLGTSDFKNAQVTAGGVCGNEIDGQFSSKKHKGLFLCGEILDINGDCGGYNLHFAWASGIKAARSACEYICAKEL